jgi:tRNA nucleotidyltransferase (CCA-adding enzyme)
MKTYLVGGAVRDHLLGLPVAERDWVFVGSTPEEMTSLGYRQVGRDFPVFLHPETSEEYALARTERKSGPGHTGFVCHAGPDVTLEEDLERRDLTVNAIAQDKSGALVDPWGGREDLRLKTLRHVSPAFSEDPLRVFRAARFAARFHDQGFVVAGETLQLMREMAHADELAELSAERVWAELDKGLETGAPAVFFAILEQADAMTPWFAELAGQGDALGELFEQVAPRLPTSAERFGALGWHLSESSIAALAERLKAPRRHARLALQVARHGRTLATWRAVDVEVVLEALVAVNAFRQPEWLELVAGVIDACSRKNQQSLTDLASALRAIDVAELIRQGYEGARLGEALDEQRRNVIAAARLLH